MSAAEPGMSAALALLALAGFGTTFVPTLIAGAMMAALLLGPF